jgi:hypothetical protein
MLSVTAFPLGIAFHGVFDEKPPSWRSAMAGESFATSDGVRLRIELGRAQMERADFKSLAPDSIAILDQRVGDLVDVYLDEVHAARGEMLKLNGKICIQIVELVHRVPKRAAA